MSSVNDAAIWGICNGNRYLNMQLIRQKQKLVRISSARMSGTSNGACVLHVSPESFVVGPLAQVQDGDTITLDVASRRLQLEISDEEMSLRKAA